MEKITKNSTLTDQELLSQCIQDSVSKPLILVFSANWISTSTIVEIVTDKIDLALPNANILKFDADENEDLFVKYKIKSIPTCILIANGEIVSKFDGIFSKKNILKMVSQHTDPLNT